MAERALGNMTVKDIHRLIVEDAATIGPDSSLRQVLAKIVEDPRTRHVYVIDRNEKLIGSIRLNAALKHLFPLTTMQAIQNERLLDVFAGFAAKCASDIMNHGPAFVYEETPVMDVVSLMIKEEVNELPVVDAQKHVIGEINFLEIINAYLTTKGD